MQIHITARHLNLTVALTNYLTKKVNKLERYFDHLVWANAILEVQKHRQSAELVIHSPLHTMRSKAEAADLYSAIDLSLDKMESQLKRLKERWKDQKRQTAASARTYSRYFVSAVSDGAGEQEGKVIDASSTPWPAAISVVKQVPVEPVSVDGAIQTMESTGYNFWMFLNKGTKKINVIFKRADESYGILEPVKKS